MRKPYPMERVAAFLLKDRNARDNNGATMKTNLVLRRSPNTVSSVFGPRAVQVYFSGRADDGILILTGTNYLLWTLINGERTWRQIRNEIELNFNKKVHQSKMHEVERSLAKLIDLGIVQSMAKKKVSTSKRPIKEKPATKVIRSRKCLTRATSDGSLQIISLHDSRHFYELTGLSARIWEKLDGRLSIKEIVTEISRKSGFPIELLEKKTHALVRDLSKSGLLENKKK